MTDRIERKVHRAVFDAANAYTDAEQAIVEARKLIYFADLEHSEQPGVAAIAASWLDKYGRNRTAENAR